MTYKLLKSQLGHRSLRYEDAVSSFGRLVNRYIVELKTWHDHNLICRSQDDMVPPLRPEWHDFEKSENAASEFNEAMQKWTEEATHWHTPYPEPEANEHIKAAVGTVINQDGTVSYHPDFEVIDDDPEWPSDEEVLRTYQDDLLAELTRREADALAKLMPPVGKRRLIQKRYAAIQSEDNKRVHEALKKLLDSGVKPEDLPDINPKEMRSNEDSQFKDEQDEITKQCDSIQSITAQAMNDIEDLTLDNIGKFELPSFDS